jgi:hypothetical protein
MGEVTPRTNFEFDVCAKGTHLFEIKETGIEEKAGRASGKRYWVRLAVVGGVDEGDTHMESFFENSKDDFSFSRLVGFLMKLGILPADLKKFDTNAFRSEKFEDNFKRALKGLKMGAKITWRYRDDDKDRESPQSEMRIYYSEAEVKELLAKKASVGAATTATGFFDTPQAAGSPSETPKLPEPPGPPKQKAPWD